MMKITTTALALALVFSAQWAGKTAFAANDVDPKCMAKGQELGVNNADVIKWKHSTANQFLARAHVQGSVSKIYPDHSGHKHFEIKLDGSAGETLEIVFNLSFGALPTLQPGMPVEACGDYITSIAQTGSYPASPDGAILHWVHGTTGGNGGSSNSFKAGHDAGYLEISDVVYGGQ